MRYIRNTSVNDWGISFMFMEENGRAFARAYTYNDDKHTIYLDYLNVNLDFRGEGVGTWLQEIREDLGRKLGYKYVCLWVKKGTWQRKWYARRGYKYYKPYKEENAVWLQKRL